MKTLNKYRKSISSQEYTAERERLEKLFHSAVLSGERDDERRVMAEIKMLDAASGIKWK